MKEYVLCYVQRGNSVLVVEKVKPAWQAGRYNLPGGSIEPGETPQQAAERELQEETGIFSKAVCAGVINGPDWKVHVLICHTEHGHLAYTKTKERVILADINWLLAQPHLLPNLRLIIPLLAFDTQGWVLADCQPDKDQFAFDFDPSYQLTLPCVHRYLCESQPT